MGHKSLDLEGKVAVVVGATSGLGRSIAIGLAEAGAGPARMLVAPHLQGPEVAVVDRGGPHVRHVQRSNVGQRDLKA